ncbi:MAG: BON domain-containing protein [Woeseiaceae bacterium]
MSMKSKITSVVAAGILGMSFGAPVIHAGESTDKTMEQRTEQAQTAIKDAWLQGKLESALLFNEYLNSFAINTEVNNGVASLRGTVESDIDRDLAGEIAESIEGVTKVNNELQVDKAKTQAAKNSKDAKQREGFKQSVLNATLTARVKTQLLMNGNTSGTAINVDTKDGVVTLSGVVESDQERELAVRIASNTNGTRSVNDQLMVEPEEDAE